MQGSNDETTSATLDGCIAPSDSAVTGVPANSATVPCVTSTAVISEGVNKPLGEPAANDDKKTKPGHGRMPHTAYKDCTEIELLLSLTVGDFCPTLCGGKLGSYKPGVIIRVKGQNFARVYRYTVNKLRCNLCGVIIGAELPAQVGTEKYDASFKAILALMKYYMAIPFYRQENFQRILGFPLSDATQWDLVEQLAGHCYGVFNVLKKLAANGCSLQNDDTKVRILEVINQLRKEDYSERTGMYTTGVIAEHEGHQIALFMNGRKHSGENVSELLQHRKPDKGPVIQMCDALSANIPKGMQTILCNCLSHGFRKFSELIDYFEHECTVIMRQLSQVFKHDEETRLMSPDERLSHHKEKSQPIMDELKEYMGSLISEHQIEPNSDLGDAIKYMLRHWPKLTRFLTVAGAPIDNNVVERALKIAIRNRKSAMFYRTIYSAEIGGMLTSLIYTCDLAGQNPHHYLIALQEHQVTVRRNPEQWLPWNYLEAIAHEAAGANVQVRSPVLDALAVG